jgi:hypothetical protein
MAESSPRMEEDRKAETGPNFEKNSRAV